MKKFTHQDKKKLAKKIGKLDKDNYIKLFKIVKQDGVKYTKNKNGVFFDFKLLSDNALQKIDDLVKSVLNNDTESSISNTYTPYTNEEFGDYRKNGVGLSKQDKTIIKKHRINNDIISSINEDSDVMYCDYNTNNLSESESAKDNNETNN